MAGFKRVVLTEKDANLVENVEKVSRQNASKKQLEAFDTNYSSKKLNELYQEFDAITFNSPSSMQATFVDAGAVAVAKTGVSVKTKIYLSAAVLVALIFAFLAIYNIFVINSLNGGIKLLQEEVVVLQNDHNALLTEHGNLQNAANITARVQEAGFNEVSSNSIINIPLAELSEPTSLGFASNWFDQLCNALGGLFGG